MEISINLSKFEAKMDAIAARAENLEPAMKNIGELVINSVHENFEQQGRPEWQKLKPATVKAREKKGHTPIMVLTETGRLMQSIAYNAGPDRVVVGTPVKYGAIHQFGGEIHIPERSGTLHLRTTASGDLLRGKRGGAVFAKKSHKRKVERDFTAGAHTITMPKRPFLKLQDQDKQEIKGIITKHLIGDL